MSRVIEVMLPDQLVADAEPVLIQGRMDLDDYILEAVRWYTRYLRQQQALPGIASWTDESAREQARLLRQIHEEMAPYTVEALQAGLGAEEEDWEAILG